MFQKPVWALLLIWSTHFACFGATPAPVQNSYPVSAIPPACLPNANAVIRRMETRFEVTAADEAELTESYAVTILNQEGEIFNRWVGAEDEFVKIKQLKAWIYNAEGEEVRSSQKTDILITQYAAEYEYSDNTYKVLKMEYPTFPYTVEFQVKQTFKGFFRVPSFDIQQLGQSVESARFQFVAPLGYRFKWKGIHTDVQPVVTTDAISTTHSWAFWILPAQKKEPHTPYFSELNSQILIAPEKVSINGYVGDFTTWENVGTFYYYINRDRDNISEEMAAQVSRITDGAATAREKITRLYKYLQDNYRYVSIQIGIGGWQTLDAKFVEQKKYGDCKALSNYMKALLRAAGIESHVAIVFAGEDGAPDWLEDLPIPMSNHVILYIPSENMWLECTSRELPAGYLGDFTANRQALLVTPDGGKLVATPVLDAVTNRTVGKTGIQLDATGNALIRETIHIAGTRHDEYRHLQTKSREDQEKAFAKHFNVSISNLDALAIKTSDRLPEASVQYTLTANHFASVSGKRLFVPLLKLDAFKNSLAVAPTRVHALYLREAYSVTDTLVFTFPEGFEVESCPPAKAVQSEYGQYEMTISVQPGLVTVLRHFEIYPVNVPAAQYEAVRKFYQEIAKADGAQMVLKAP